MNSDILYDILLSVSALMFVAISIWFYRRNRAQKASFAQTHDVWLEVSVWRSYGQLKAHQQQLIEWQQLYDAKTNNISRAVAKMKVDVFSLNPVADATSEVLQLAKDEKYLTDLAVLGFDYCLNWAMDDFKQEFHCRATPNIEIETNRTAYDDLVFWFRIVLDLARCSALKKDKAVVFLFLKMSENSIRLKFEEAKNEMVEHSNQQVEMLASRIKSRLISRGIAIPISFFKDQNLDLEISKEI